MPLITPFNHAINFDLSYNPFSSYHKAFLFPFSTNACVIQSFSSLYFTPPLSQYHTEVHDRNFTTHHDVLHIIPFLLFPPHRTPPQDLVPQSPRSSPRFPALHINDIRPRHPLNSEETARLHFLDSHSNQPTSQ